jgi:hypothetical protein
MRESKDRGSKWLIEHPKGDYRIPAERSHTSRLGHTTLGVKWTVMELWGLRAQTLLDLKDVGVIPYIPLTQFDEPPEQMLAWCRQRIEQGAPPEQRNNLLAITWVMAGTRYKDEAMLAHLLRRAPVIDSPVLQQLVAERYGKELQMAKEEGKMERARADIVGALEVRFGSVPAELAAIVGGVEDEQRLRDLLREAILCRDVEAFRAFLGA